MDADYLQIVADVAPTHCAGVAMATTDDRIDNDHFADPRCIDAGADGIDLPYEFVADHPGIDDKWILAMENVNIRAANSGEPNADADLACFRLWLRPLAHGHLVGLLDNDTQHRVTSLPIPHGAIA